MRGVGLDDGFEGVVVVVAFGSEFTAGTVGGEASGGATSLVGEAVVGALWVVDAGRELVGALLPLVFVRSMTSAYGQL